MLKKIIQAAIGGLIRFSGLYRLLSLLIWRRQTTILVYHDPRPEVFGRHIKFLSKYHTFISLSRLVEAIYKNDKSEIPVAPLVVTLDDGHKGNVKLFGTFKEFNLRPTIYLCSHIVNTHRHFWWKSGYPDPQALKNLPNSQALALLQLKANFYPEKEYADRQALNKNEMMELLLDVEFGSHTKFHPILTNCEAEECEEEIRESKAWLEEMLNRRVDHFCYPNGKYDEREIDLLKRHHYRSARTLEWGRNRVDADPFRLNVVEVLDDSSTNLLCAQLCGFWGWFRNMRAKFRRTPAKQSAITPDAGPRFLEKTITEAPVSIQ
jgi:peptidoglycan/xylan/chitin deacetylase (PgdA/CDA1 family)